MRKLIVLSLLVLILLMVVSGASAITYGVPDDGAHPGVGALVGQFSAAYPFCSGALISPTVFLTAAHCNPAGIDDWWVSFDEAIDPSGAGTRYYGTFIPHPSYPGPASNTYDIAVVILDQPAPFEVYDLPAAGQFDRLQQQNNAQQFTAVGYGSFERVNQPGGPVFPYPDARYKSTPSLNSVNNNWLRLSQNPANGNSGACYGDSGGPNFLGAGTGETDIIAGITITGDVPCRATNVIYRLDSPTARAFLGQFVALP